MLLLAYKLDAKSMGFFTLAIDMLFLTDYDVTISVQIRCQVYGVLHSSNYMLFLTDCDVIISVQIRCQVYGVLHHSSN